MRRILALFLIVSAARADQTFPREGWQEQPNPFASPDAVPGGELSAFAGQYPKSLNYYLDFNSFTADVFGSMYETLLGMNPVTMDYEPGIAEKWSISDDKKTFTFWISPRAKWSDGRPITAGDVRWTFDTIMDPANPRTGAHKVALEAFEPPVVVDERQIRFTAKYVHWRNLQSVGAGLLILPRHAFEKQDFNKINFSFPVVSGPYRLGEIKEGISLALERRPDWWNRESKSARGTANFQTLRYKFFAEQENGYEAFKKGAIDFFAVYMARIWVKETSGEKFDKNWIVKQKVFNYSPVGFQGFAMNTRRPPFDDVRVRHALCYLLDRERMNATIMYNQYFLHRSYYEDLYSPTNPCPNELIPFDKARARTLFAEAGWKANPATGFLEKSGKRLTFRFLNRDASSEKFLSIFAEALRDVGIEMKIDQKDWAAWSKDMEEFNYDMTWAAWSGGVFKDPEGMWSSKEADRRNGSNITGFKDKEVDELIERQKTIFDINERNAICRRIDQIVYKQYPYILLWNLNYTRLLYWNKFGTPPSVLGKFGTENAAAGLWWHDPDSGDDLKTAMEKGTALPLKKPEVRFDEVVKP